MATRIGWTFVDTPDITLTLNPESDSGSLAVTKVIEYEVAAGPGGKTLIYESGTEMPTVSFSGYVYTEEQYNILAAEVEKDLSIMTDDRGVTYNIIWSKFTTNRVRSKKYPWRHDYELEGRVKSYNLGA